MHSIAMPGSLKRRVLHAASWTTGGYAANQVMRFASNLVMTRILFPEAFGLMAIVQAVLLGVTMLSDMAASQSVVRSARGADPAYVNTAWTIQILQGAFVALVLFVGAGPIAAHYVQPLLADLIRVAAIVSLIGGFNSTKIALAERNVDAKRVTVIDTASLAASIVASILFAWYDPTPFALVLGNIVGALCKVLASHFWLHGQANRLAWDTGAARNVFSFGSKVVLSSTVTYMAGEGGKLLAANLISVNLLALLALAANLNMVVWRAIQQLSGRVLFPAYAEVLRDDPTRLPRVVERTRFVQVFPACAVSIVFALLGTHIVHLLYDQRYAGAGLLLQIGAVGTMVDVLTGSYGGVLWAMGRVGLGTILLCVQVVLQWGGMLIGHHVAGPLGVVVGATVGGILNYPVTAIAYSRFGLWHWRVDVPVLLSAVLAGAVVVLTGDWSIAKVW